MRCSVSRMFRVWIALRKVEMVFGLSAQCNLTTFLRGERKLVQFAPVFLAETKLVFEQKLLSVM